MRAPRRDVPTNRLLFRDVVRLRTRLFDRLLEPHGITMSQAWVLAYLLWDGDLNQVELAARLEVGAVATGKLVERLEARGLVTRTSDPNDRRANRVRLTEQAYPIVDAMTGAMLATDEVTYAGLSPQQRELLEHQLQAIRDNLVAALAEPELSRAGRSRCAAAD
ncbi:MarR family winged helix-turn-helix transcriptional regulator [Acuticoccus sp.]|uniref:MarR family winged helix-turn-helix transcriptional regulator n=1 Tax=Acuticoccus sp. TaxID=1904378 RepID=UPI003B522FA6